MTVTPGHGCWRDDSIQHEVLHVLGIHHEQVRYDRDDFVQVHLDRIKDGMEPNFDKLTSSVWLNQNTPYDYWSVLQYNGNWQSNNGLPTITMISSIVTELRFPFHGFISNFGGFLRNLDLQVKITPWLDLALDLKSDHGLDLTKIWI